MNMAIKAKTPKYIFLRGSTYYYIRNIAPHHRHRFDGKKQIWQTLKTSEYHEAVLRSEVITREHDAIISGSSFYTPISFSDEVVEATKLNLTHTTSAELRLKSIEESIRIIAERLPLAHLMTNPAPITVAALLGESNRDDDVMRIHDAFVKFQAITPDFIADKNEYEAGEKVRSWKRSMDDFIARVGDINVVTLTEAVADDYVLSIKTDVVNKVFGSFHGNRLVSRVRQVLQAALKKHYQITFTHLNGKTIKVKNADGGKRLGFTEANVKAIYAALPTFDLPDEAKAIIKLSLITGCTAKELCWLTASDIFPDAKVPYIKIGPNALRLVVKSGGDRHRDLPIVTREGIEIIKKYRNGFPSFQDDRGAARFNKKMNNFFPVVTPGYSFYSARHRMDDLIKIAGVDLGIKAALSGHSLGGHLHYYGKSGNGYTLKQKSEAIEKALLAAPIKEEQEIENS